MKKLGKITRNKKKVNKQNINKEVTSGRAMVKYDRAMIGDRSKVDCKSLK